MSLYVDNILLVKNDEEVLLTIKYNYTPHLR